MKRYRHPLLWFGLLLFGVFAFLRLPTVLFAATLPAPVQAGDVSGTLWEGRIGQLGVGGQQLLQDVRWHWQPGALLKGALAWQLETHYADAPAGTARAVLSAAGWRLENVSMTVPASPLMAQVKMLSPFQLGGDLQIRAAALAQNHFEQTSILWQDASSLVTPQVNPFGNYLINVQQQGAATNWAMQPQGGMLAISGGGAITNNGPTGALTFTPTPGKEAMFTALLDRMGPSHTLQLGSR
ncbi:hypothetical protein JCM19000A_05450 [Silvimonas sp. JCM 19000]